MTTKARRRAGRPAATRTRCNCPYCGKKVPIDALATDQWLPQLRALAARFSGTGITPDLAALCPCEAYGLFLSLSSQVA